MRNLSILLALAACGGGSSSTDAPHRDGKPGDGTGNDIGPPMVDADLSCPNPGSIPALAPHQIVTGLTAPLYLAQPPGSTDLYVVEKAGRIKIVRNGAIAATFLDISANVLIPDSSSEGGMLSMEFAKDYASSGRFWVYATLKADTNGGNRAAVIEYKRSTGNADAANPTPVRELLFYSQDGYNNIGGTIRLGPDNYLWWATGDRAAQPSPAPDITDRAGKVLRIDVDNPSQPPPGGISGGDPYVWDYGLRNPFRFSFDRVTHEAYIADAGDTMYEEVDIEAPGVGHHNFGWDVMEGKHCKDGTTTCSPMGTLPQYERAHASSYSVIVGGTVYRGSALPCLRGRYIFAIFGTGQVLSWVWNGSAITSETELTDSFGSANIMSITSIVEDQAGELYLTTIDGVIYKIIPA